MPEISEQELNDLKAKAQTADQVTAEKEKLAKDLEDTRMEVLTPEYTKFLESLDKDKKVLDKKDPPAPDDLSKLTPAQLLAKAKQEIREEMEADRTKKEKESIEDQRARNEREIAKFKSTHDDFDQFRPVMYGLSKDPKNADMNLSELYEAAKKHVASIKGITTEDDKNKSRRSSNEKPGSSSESFEKYKKMSSSQINREAMDEVKKELGPIPAA